MLPNIHSTDYK